MVSGAEGAIHLRQRGQHAMAIAIKARGGGMKRAFVFPGQGAQSVGMGKALADAYPAARAVFDEVDDDEESAE